MKMHSEMYAPRVTSLTAQKTKHLVMPVFFRLLYGCGLRLTEARLLKVMDVDLSEGVITVTNAKLDKHRQLPVSPELLERLKIYHQNDSFPSKKSHYYSVKDSMFPRN